MSGCHQLMVLRCVKSAFTQEAAARCSKSGQERHGGHREVLKPVNKRFLDTLQGLQQLL